MQNITKSWLKEKKACKESYSWLDKQENKSWKAIANKLYKEGRFDWCFWLLCRKTRTAKTYAMFFLLFPLALPILAICLAYLGLVNESVATGVAAVATGVAAVAVAVGGVAVVVGGVAGAGVVGGAAVVVGAGAGVVAVVVAVAAVAAVAVAAAGAAGGVAVGVVVGGVAGAGADDNNIFVRLGCKLALNDVNASKKATNTNKHNATGDLLNHMKWMWLVIPLLVFTGLLLIIGIILNRM